MREIKTGELYRHFKTGNVYEIIAIAKHSETLEDMVIYEAKYKNDLAQIWARSLKNFLEEVEWQGKKIKRFERIT